MSSTRTSKDDSVFHQNRFASSPEFERGLVASLVARRCSVLDTPADRELIWFLQYLSHQAGGLAAVVKELLAAYPERVQTAAMAELGIKPGVVCEGAAVRTIRSTLPKLDRSKFLLGGEFEFQGVIRAAASVGDLDGLSQRVSELVAEASRRPASYPAEVFCELCRAAAAELLERELSEICLDPARKLAGGPWYFAGLAETLREYQAQYVASQGRGVVTTELGQRVNEALDYTQSMRLMTLLEGQARRGKTFSAKAWCARHPGRARFVEVPPGNDDASFFRALARGLGLGNFLQYKVGDVRERVEAVLLTGDLLLVLDEAHKLWPQRNLRYGYPSRINWVMSLANHNVPICMIGTPQFVEFQKRAEHMGGWNSAQLSGRILNYDTLPAELSLADLKAVAQAALPEADSQTINALAAYARSSARYLSAIEAIGKRASFIATRAGRPHALANDVRQAMKETVIPSDSRLVTALEGIAQPGRIRTPAAPQPREAQVAAADAEAVITQPGPRGGLGLPAERRQAGDLVELA